MSHLAVPNWVPHEAECNNVIFLLSHEIRRGRGVCKTLEIVAISLEDIEISE